ncbi:MAG: Head fiber protein [Oscillospiraceae bacterium]|nr:Head fiber protein [Oscillospiraceae bacterium]
MDFNAKNYTEPGGERTVIGGELVIEPGAKLTALPGSAVEGLGGGGAASSAANQPASTASTVATLREDFNALLAKLKAAGLMTADGAGE